MDFEQKLLEIEFNYNFVEIILTVSDLKNWDFFRRNIVSKGYEGDCLKKTGLD
ncbi:MAG: hypothetical protein ACTSQH_01720 [Candidatus Hodarchaeales archaeon]